MTISKAKKNILCIKGNGLFSKEEVTVSISKLENNEKDIVFVLNGQSIPAKVENVTNAIRNTVLTNGKESICLVEHFLATCSLLGINGIEVTTNKNELIFGDGSAMHWKDAFLKSNVFNITSSNEKYELKEALFVKNDTKAIAAIPHKGFKVSYFMDWDHPALGKLFLSWEKNEDVNKLLQARSFGTKEENDFFHMSDKLLTLNEDGFNKKLHDPLEPLYHKILDIIGDLRLCGINPLEINMHVIGIKSGHALNVELAKILSASLTHTDWQAT